MRMLQNIYDALIDKAKFVLLNIGKGLVTMVVGHIRLLSVSNENTSKTFPSNFLGMPHFLLDDKF